MKAKEKEIMKLIDVIHLYIGCFVEIDGKEYGRLIGGDYVPNEVNNIYHNIEIDAPEEESGKFIMPYNDNPDTPLRVKPILRPLSDMTEKEARQCWKISNPLVSYRFSGFDGQSRSIFYKNGNGNNGSEVLNKPSQFVYLLSKRFDLFGLIESGQAINKTEIENL